MAETTPLTSSGVFWDAFWKSVFPIYGVTEATTNPDLPDSFRTPNIPTSTPISYPQPKPADDHTLLWVVAAIAATGVAIAIFRK